MIVYVVKATWKKQQHWESFVVVAKTSSDTVQSLFESRSEEDMALAELSITPVEQYEECVIKLASGGW